MRYVLGLAWLLMTWPASGLAGEQPPLSPAVESLLPADALAYVRYDGYEPHRKAYEQTALGRAMRDDLGEFLEYLGSFLAENLLVRLKEKNPAAIQKLAGSGQRFATYLWRHGLVLAVEARNLPPGANPLPLLDLKVRVRLTLIFPEGGTAQHQALLLPLLSGLAANGDTPVKTRPLRGRTLHEWVEGDFRAAWWPEGRHLILVLGNDTVEDALDVVERRRPNLQTSKLFQGVAAFKDYETDLRGFVDLQKIVALARTITTNDDKLAQVKELLTRSLLFHQLGLPGLKSLTFHLGFDRQYQRSTMVVHVAEPSQRTGLLRLVFAPVAFVPAALPPLPPDAASVRVSAVDWFVFHDVVRQMSNLARLQGVFSSGVLPKDPLANLGVDLSREILAHLDSTLVLYNSLSEGPFVLGQGVAIKVKNEKKLGDGIQKLAQGLARDNTLGIEIQKRTYRGVDLFTLSLPAPYPLAPTYTIHKGWLVLGTFPQSVKGFILRAEGNYKVWQPPALAAEALALAGKRAGPRSKLAAVTVNDPRPPMAVGLSLLPVVARVLGASGLALDVTRIPNAQAVTEWQFPGVTVFHDDGNALRWESHSSIDVPGDWLLLYLAAAFSSF
jgi:hypothetical protein